LQQHARALRLVRILDPDVGVTAGAPRGGVGDQLAIVRPVDILIARAAISQQRNAAAVQLSRYNWKNSPPPGLC